MTRNRAWAFVLAGALGLMLAACSSSSPVSSPAAPAREAPLPAAQVASSNQVIALNTGDYYFNPGDITVRPGTITLNLTNDGPRRHTFYMRNAADTDDIVKSDDRLVPGASETLTFTVTDAGRYKIYCAIPGHADRGEVGFISVAG